MTIKALAPKLLLTAKAKLLCSTSAIAIAAGCTGPIDFSGTATFEDGNLSIGASVTGQLVIEADTPSQGEARSGTPEFSCSANAKISATQAKNLEFVCNTAAKHGINPHDFVTVAWIESRLNPNAKNPHSTASGTFQFIRSTARAYGLHNPFDAEANATAAAQLWKDNERHLKQTLGRSPEGWEMYLAHQQGAGGAAKLLKQQDALATTLVGADAVKLNGDRFGHASAADFTKLWRNKFEAAANNFH